MGVIANQTVTEREELINEWLSEQLGSPVDEIGLALMEADHYAEFLNRYLDIKDPTRRHEGRSALMAWRERQQP